TLIERAGRRVRLTQECHVLVDRTERVLVALEEAQAALEQARPTISGELRVAASGSVARAFVIPVIAEVARAWPRLHLRLLQYEPDQSMRELRLGDIDVVVAHEYEHDRQRADPDLVRAGLFAEDLHV